MRVLEPHDCLNPSALTTRLLRMQLPDRLSRGTVVHDVTEEPVWERTVKAWEDKQVRAYAHARESVPVTTLQHVYQERKADKHVYALAPAVLAVKNTRSWFCKPATLEVHRDTMDGGVSPTFLRVVVGRSTLDASMLLWEGSMPWFVATHPMAATGDVNYQVMRLWDDLTDVPERPERDEEFVKGTKGHRRHHRDGVIIAFDPLTWKPCYGALGAPPVAPTEEPAASFEPVLSNADETENPSD